MTMSHSASAPFPLTESAAWQRQLLTTTLLALAVLLAWDASGADLALARAMGSPQGFALRSHWFLISVAHEGGRLLAWIAVLGLALCIRWPVGLLRQVPRSRRVQLVLGALLGLLVMSLLKLTSTTSCPWDLAEFGGTARYVSHWHWGVSDGGAGHCFPAGHASAGFAFLSAYFALHHSHPRAARYALWAALIAGAALGLGQQLRGAHYLSHTLWTAWLCWVAAWAMDRLTTWWLSRRNAVRTLPDAAL